MIVLLGIFWTIVGAGAQVAFLAALTLGVYHLDKWMAQRHRRAELRRYGR